MDLKLLLKRGALLTAANWPLVAIQFVAETTFQVLLAVPIVGAAILVAVLLGADLANVLRGSMQEIFTTIARALTSEPVALFAFVAAFVIVLLGGSIVTFLVKGGTVEVLLAAERAAGPIEREPLTLHSVRDASAFTVPRFIEGCSRLFQRYLILGMMLLVMYALTGGAYFTFIVVGYRAATRGSLMFGWAVLAFLATVALVVWITLVNFVYLLLQLVIALDDVGLAEACRGVLRVARDRFRLLGSVFLVVLVMVVAATFASALAWSGVGLVAFVPLVGLAVFPLQIAALLLRGLVFEYIGLTALGSYIALYRQYADARAVAAATASGSPADASRPGRMADLPERSQ